MKSRWSLGKYASREGAEPRSPSTSPSTGLRINSGTGNQFDAINTIDKIGTYLKNSGGKYFLKRLLDVGSVGIMFPDRNTRYDSKTSSYLMLRHKGLLTIRGVMSRHLCPLHCLINFAGFQMNNYKNSVNCGYSNGKRSRKCFLGKDICDFLVRTKYFPDGVLLLLISIFCVIFSFQAYTINGRLQGVYDAN
jgi:hypothetical protein